MGSVSLALVQQEMAYGAVYAYLGISLLLIAGFVAVVMVLARLLSPSRQGSVDKRATYETSEKTVTDPWRPFPVRYYVFALTFLIFDVEALFLFPWAVVYGDLGRRDLTAPPGQNGCIGRSNGIAAAGGRLVASGRGST